MQTISRSPVFSLLYKQHSPTLSPTSVCTCTENTLAEILKTAAGTRKTSAWTARKLDWQAHTDLPIYFGIS